MDHNYIAVDLGAESGRVMLARLVNDRLSIEEIHRFANGPVEQNGSLRWDFDRLMGEIKAGISKATEIEKNITSLAVDTWGVDFGLLDGSGKLIENPYHYRDSRTENIFDQAFEIMPAEGIYNNTGIQIMPINSLYQLLALRDQKPEVFGRVEKILFMPDLINYYLTGKSVTEYTIASTSQLMDMSTGQWSKEILKTFDISPDIFADIVKPGTVIGQIKSELAAEFGCQPFDVVTVGSHDTASAVAAIPAEKQTNWAYLSSGTWSLMGKEISEPVINSDTCKYQFTNEGGVSDTIRLLKNIGGLWIVQECRRFWAEQGEEFTYSELTEMASKAEVEKAVIDVDHPPFLSPGDMPLKINDYLKSTGQDTIDDKGQMIRVVLESLAKRYAQVIGILEQITAQRIDILHIVGGGIKNQLLQQLTADATGRIVKTGPAEATVAGNVLLQCIASGQIDSLWAGREIISKSFEAETYKSS